MIAFGLPFPVATLSVVSASTLRRRSLDELSMDTTNPVISGGASLCWQPFKAEKTTAALIDKKSERIVFIEKWLCYLTP